MNQIRIKTPSRLHFGLLGLGEPAPRRFGGLGLMIEDPGLELSVESAENWSAHGPLSERALTVARSVAERLELIGKQVQPQSIRIRHAPRLHTGLGVGTQLSLAIAHALGVFAGIRKPSALQLAELSGRGDRSGIGIHGFAQGGLIVDAGRLREQVPTRVLRVDFPQEWSILVVTPEEHVGIHGKAEAEAFLQLPPIPEIRADQLCKLVLLRLLPAVVEGDLAEFGHALTSIQEKVGLSFADAQGGAYASSHAEKIIIWLRGKGLAGVGQSSWGPTLYGFSEASLIDRLALRAEIVSTFNIPNSRVIWTKAMNRGAKMLCE